MPFKRQVTRAYMLAGQDKDLKVTQAAGKTTIALPAQQTAPVASVLVLESPETASK